jgi:DNA-binding transcriptional regulator YiaG
MTNMSVTDKQIPLNSSLVQKFDLMIERVEQTKPCHDTLVSIEGSEGVGKTTMAVILGYYVHSVTGRPFSEKNVFADVKKAIDFAQNTFGQIVIFDEPALDALSAEWWKESQKDLIKLLMLSRKKRHFFIFNITKFYKFSEYIVVDRAVCMIHLYEQQNDNRPAFAYIGKMCLENLYNDYRKKRERNYRKYKMFTGTFPDVLDPKMSYNILDHFNVEEYEKEKDKAILSIGKKMKNDVKELKRKLGSLKFPIPTQIEFAKRLEVSITTLKSWKEDSMDKKIEENQLKSQKATLLSISTEDGED